ncbi:MAG: hypothetical protein K2N06_07255, partial [Oscillospiraceae bacterium]|nr:hypothetical protein [Oscillospiraceae bacterium]
GGQHLRKLTEPKISFIMVNYTGNKETFKSFMKGVISDYLNSDKLPKLQENPLVGNVEIPQKAK